MGSVPMLQRRNLPDPGIGLAPFPCTARATLAQGLACSHLRARSPHRPPHWVQHLAHRSWTPRQAALKASATDVVAAVVVAVVVSAMTAPQ